MNQLVHFPQPVPVLFEDRDNRAYRLDPTRCKDLRARAITTFRRSIAKWKEETNRALSFELALTPSEQVERFTQFIHFSASRSFDTRDVVSKIFRMAYDRGCRMAYSELGSKDGPLHRSSSSLYGHLMEAEIRAAVESSATATTKALASGVLTQRTPRQLRKITSFALQRSMLNRLKTAVNTLITMAYNHGKLDIYESLGVQKVGVIPEHLPAHGIRDARPKRGKRLYALQTAGDNRVCDICDDLEGNVYTLAEARGVIPVHPNCRCVVVPANRGII
jgi:hypothetical protein